MKKMKHVLGHALALACLATASQAARADAPEWKFVYTGFNVTDTTDGGSATYFDPNAQFWGSFAGTDANSDGVLTSTELSSLIVYGSYYLPDDGMYGTSTIDQFSYSAKDGLSFKLSHDSHDPEGYLSWHTDVESGVVMHRSTYSMFSGGSSYMYEWTSQTKFELTSPVPTPVPEPSQWMLLGAGAALLTGLRRRGAVLNK
ncbi:MAG: PEP-CTERM sorting domain-containing protein [Gammaproteobacteria bacterium]